MKNCRFFALGLLAIASAGGDWTIWPFPDRMSAFVWRNWEIVPKRQLAATTGATEADIERIANEMGLPSQGAVDPRWRTVGRHTIVRRNWNLVPKSQWQAFVDRDEAAFSNSSETTDYEQIHFGGGEYPKLPELKYDAREAKDHMLARRRLAALAETEGCLAAGKAWKPFAFLDELDRLTGARSDVSEGSRRFKYRMNCFPYAGEWTDGLLEKNAAVGINAIWTVADFASVVKDPRYPELGVDAGRYYAKWSDLVARAAKHGIKVFLFFNDPKQQPAAFFEKPGREEIRGMPNSDGTRYSLCTSTPEVRRWLEDGMAEIFAAVPGLGGFVTITASEALTNCSSRRSLRGRCARCRDRSAGSIFAGVHAAMSRGMRRSSPDALAICWDWGWNEDEAMEAISLLPKGDGLLAMSEKGLETVTGGVTNEVREYSLSRLGPSGRALREWSLAKSRGLVPLAKVQVGSSWEFASVPEIPVRELVAGHMARVSRTPVAGIVVSWTVGSYPGLNMQLACDWPVRPAMPDTRRASNAFLNYPYNGGTLYCGTQHLGPGNPLYPFATGKLATMTGIPYDNLDRWRGNIPTNDWVAAMDAVAKGADGLMALHFRSAAEQARFTVAHDAGDRAGMKRAALRERETAKSCLSLIEKDSRLAFESSNSYFYTPQDLREKVVACSLLAEPDVVLPEKTMSFPGSGCTSFDTDGKVLYAASSWTREKGAAVFDVSDPANMRFTANMPARGYTTSDPVVVGERVYQPLWYGVMRVNVADPARPVIEEMMNYDWPVHSADSIFRAGDELNFVSKNGTLVYDVSDASRPARFVRREAEALKPPKATRDPRVKFLPKGVRGGARFAGDVAFAYDRSRSSFRSFRVAGTNAVELCERFMLHSLSTLAVVGNTAYVNAATQPVTTGLLTLDLTKTGCVDFGPKALFRQAPPGGSQGFTMLMQSIGAIVDLGGGYLLADDAAVKLGEDGTPSYLGDRAWPVCNYAVDGGRVALAQSDRVRLLDVSDPECVRETARVKYGISTHATGVAIEGDTIWAITDEKPDYKRNHRHAFLGYVPPKSTLRRYRVDGTNLVETASCDVPTSVGCVLARDGFLYLSGMRELSLVDGRAMKLAATFPDLIAGSSYKIKRFGERIFYTDSRSGVKELDWADLRRPSVVRVYRRDNGDPPPVDDFTLADGRLYSLSHSSLDVFRADGESGRMLPPSPHHALNFGARELASVPFGDDGFEAVAFGEGGLYIRRHGAYVAEPPDKEDGSHQFCADSVVAEGTRLVVTDRSHKETIVLDVANPCLPRVVERRPLDVKQ